VRQTWSTALLFAASSLLCSAPTNASAAQHHFSLEPRLLKTELVPLLPKQKTAVKFVSIDTEPHQVARFNSGMGLAFDTPLLQVSVDYKVSSLLREKGAFDDAQLSQSVGASVRSTALNKLLKLDAGIDTQSQIREGGDAYQYKILPGFSTSLGASTKMKMQYQYLLAKESNQNNPSERKGYLMDLSGSLQNGRLRWNGSFQSASDYDQQQLKRSKSSENFVFKTRYRIASDLELELSSVLKQQIEYAAKKNKAQYEKNLSAGLAWSPSAQYTLAVKLQRRDDSRFDEKEVIGSGRASWFPSKDLSLSVDYGEQLYEGARGVIVSTELKLGGRY
jgi:hypothetical protein